MLKTWRHSLHSSMGAAPGLTWALQQQKRCPRGANSLRLFPTVTLLALGNAIPHCTAQVWSWPGSSWVPLLPIAACISDISAVTSDIYLLWGSPTASPWQCPLLLSGDLQVLTRGTRSPAGCPPPVLENPSTALCCFLLFSVSCQQRKK